MISGGITGAAPAAVQESVAAPQAAEIVRQASTGLRFEQGTLTGEGIEVLLDAAENAQFLIVIESHNDHVTPLITAGLFEQMHARHGFDYLALEQDPLGMAAASARFRRGRLDRIVEHARAHPFSYTFNTDEELRLIADAGRISRGAWRPVWGVDQLFGAAAAPRGWKTSPRPRKRSRP